MATEAAKADHFNNRILICDDNKSIHEDLFKIFHPPPRVANAEVIRDLEAKLFDDPREISVPERVQMDFVIDSAYSGREALAMAKEAQERGEPYAVIFMDVRMPPGPDGLFTIKELWKTLPATEVVVLTAHSDYSWDEMIHLLGSNDKLLYLNKPFSSISVKQVALNLVNKWNLSKELKDRLRVLEGRQAD